MTHDEAAIRRLQDGDLDAFDELVDLHYAACLRVAWGQLGDRADAEDAVQDALVRAFRSVRKGRVPRSFRPWLLEIVVRRCRSMTAKRTRRQRLFTLWRRRAEQEPRYVAPVEVEDRPDPILDEALGALTPRLREAFLLKHVEELTYEETSQVTGASVSALKMRVKRASEQLLEHLSRNGDDPQDEDIDPERGQEEGG